MEEKLETLTIKDYVDIYNLLVGVLLCLQMTTCHMRFYFSQTLDGSLRANF